MAQRARVFWIVILLLLIPTIISIVWIPLNRWIRADQDVPEQTVQPFPPLQNSGIGIIEIAASQTAQTLLAHPTPFATLMPGLKNWIPPSTGTYTLSLFYDSTRWALTDSSTLASLQISQCTLRRAGGRGLGPGWSTEESSLKAEDISFLVIISKYQGVPQFVTYSGPDDVVFEITAPAQLNMCVQAGESILKSIKVY